MGAKDFLDLCESYGVNIALVIFLLLSVASLYLPFKEHFLSRIRHKRNRRYFVFGLLYLLADVIIYDIDIISIKTAILLACADLLYLAYCVWTISHCSPIAAYYIKTYERFLDEGLTSEHIGYFEKQHRYICESIDKIRYARLKARYYADLGQMIAAYKAADEIHRDALYEKESRDLETIKAVFLWQMGDLSAASKLLEDDKYNNDPIKHMLASFVLEFSGDLDGAYEKMREAKDMCTGQSVSPECHMRILQNFGRIQRLRGNLTEAVQYMHRANKKLEKMANPRADLQRNIKEALIFNEALAQGNAQCVEKLLAEYRKQIPADSIGNLIAYNNCCIEVYRQFGDKKKVYERIKSGYYELIGKLDDKQKALYQASTFSMLMNGEYVHDWLDAEIAQTYNSYGKLPLPERIAVYKNFAGIFQQPAYFCVRNISPYKELWEQIKEYYATSAIADIDNYLISLDEHEIYSRGGLVQDKLDILKYIQRDKHIDKSKQIYIDIYNMYNDAGLQIDAVNMLMILADECGSPYNLKVRIDPTSEPVIYQDWLDGLTEAPEPHAASNGYQLDYARLQPRFFGVYPQKANVIEEQLRVIMPIVKTWRDHPAKYEFSVHIAHFLMALNRRDEAREFYDILCQNRLSIDHYAMWMKDELYALTAEFEPDKLQDMLGGRRLT